MNLIYDLATSKNLRGLVDYEKTLQLLDLEDKRVDQTFDSSMIGDEQAYNILQKHYDPKKEFPLFVYGDGDCFLTSVSHSLLGSTTKELNKELRLIMTSGLIKNASEIINEATSKGFHESGQFIEEIAVAATPGEYVRAYGMLGFAFGSRRNIQIVYPPENGPNCEQLAMYNDTFPTLPENSFNTDQTIKVSNSYSTE